MKYRVFIATLIVLALSAQALPQSDSQCLLPIVTAKPTARSAHSMVFDPYNEATVVFGGTSLDGGIHSIAETLIYSYGSNTWAELSCSTAPPARANHAMVYSNQTNEIILFGGFGVTDTWSFDCATQTWSEVVTATSPGVHHSLALAYDPQENAVILFGGFNESGWETDDTWRFDCDTREWTELHPTTTPLARYGHVMVYDESINLIVLTAGNTASQGHQHDTWTYNASANVWTELTPIGTPDRLKWPSMTYDSVNQKCILFGGQIGDNPVDHTWVYDAQQNTWTRQYPSNAPSARINAGLAFDSENNITILFGGTALGAHQFDDTWTYSYESNAWTNVTYGAGPSSSTTPTPTPSGGPGFDPVLLALALPIGASIIVIVAVILRKKP